MINENTLKTEELAAFTLRSLYSKFGYTRYKMSKFEEYDLYVQNKDFLISDGIITFTDTNGKLLALKPDVTLSIIKNSKDTKGYTEKLYYDENVYRISSSSDSFKEIKQTGLECIGDISLYDVSEVLYLAIKSLSLIDNNYILDIAHAGLYNSVFSICDLSKENIKTVASAIANKSKGEIENLFKNGEISSDIKDILISLVKNYNCYNELEKAFSKYLENEEIKSALEEFKEIWETVEAFGFDSKIKIDFSIVNNSGYYSGIVFKGYIKNIPSSVLSGGRYDKLMKKMGKNAGAVGFAVYLDMLERHNFAEESFDYDYLLIRGKSTSVQDIINKVEELSKENKSVFVSEEIPLNIRYNKCVDLTLEEN